MAHVQTSKVLLHATAEDGKKVYRWVVAAFANKTDAGTYAGLIKQAHAAKDSDAILRLDQATPKTADGVPVSPVKLSVQTVPYSPHKTAGSGLDEDMDTPQS